MNAIVIFAVTLSVFLLVVVGMAIGVIMGRREISGSCGGLANQRDADGSTSCSLCSDPDAACKELGQRMRSASTSAAETHPACEKDCLGEDCSKEQIDACKDH